MGASALKRTVATAFIIGCGLCLGMAARAAAQSVPPRAPTVFATGRSPCELPSSAAVSGSEQIAIFGQAPLRFEANQGQHDGTVTFLARSRGYTVFLTATETVVLLPSSGSAATPLRHSQPTVVRMRLLDANSAPQVEGLEELPGKVHYLLGKDPRKWRRNVPTYAKVRYRQVYPGVDLVYYGHDGEIEYDFVVAPGADPTAIRLGIRGANALELTAEGDLVLHTTTGDLRLQKPFVYQSEEGGRHAIPARYVVTGPGALGDRRDGGHTVGIDVAAYDPRRPVIIDPFLSYATYVGGSGDERGAGIAVDASGAVYLTGETNSVDFPAQAPLQGVLGGRTDAFVTKIDPSQVGAASLVFSTYLGGSSDDRGFGIAVDATGAAYVTGETTSDDFPTPNGYQSVRSGPANAFVAKLSPDGSGIAYATYLGGSARTLVGSGLDAGRAIAVDSAGAAYVTGETSSSGFPVKNAFKTTLGTSDPSDAFVTKIDPAQVGAASLVYSTYLGGSLADRAFGIAVDTAGAAYVTGETRSLNFPAPGNPFQRQCASVVVGTTAICADAFVTKIDPSRVGQAALIYSTYLGGYSTRFGGPANNKAFNAGRGIAVDATGAAYVTGETSAFDNPPTPGFPTMNALQVQLQGCTDAFVTKLTSDGAALLYSSYLGGSGSNRGFGIAVDAAGAAYVTGETSSADFPTQNAIQPALGGGTDAFVTKIDPSQVGMASLVFSTYLGGSGADRGLGIAVDAAGAAYVVGRTRSPDLLTPNGFQLAPGGGSDAFITKISP